MNLVHCILCNQYILPDRFSKNNGYLVEREILLTFLCQFQSKRCFEKSKNKDVLVKFYIKMAVLRCFLTIEINLHVVQWILCGQYIYWLTDF